MIMYVFLVASIVLFVGFGSFYIAVAETNVCFPECGWCVLAVW